MKNVYPEYGISTESELFLFKALIAISLISILGICLSLI